MSLPAVGRESQLLMHFKLRQSYKPHPTFSSIIYKTKLFFQPTLNIALAYNLFIFLLLFKITPPKPVVAPKNETKQHSFRHLFKYVLVQNVLCRFVLGMHRLCGMLLCKKQILRMKRLSILFLSTLLFGVAFASLQMPAFLDRKSTRLNSSHH